MRLRTSLIAATLATAFGLGLAVATQACSSTTAGSSDQAGNEAACMHICQCEAGGDVTTCDQECSNAFGSTSFSGFSSFSGSSLSLSYAGGSYDYSVADQQCASCFATAPCADIVNGTACPAPCQ
jgi:hypothetical protein